MTDNFDIVESLFALIDRGREGLNIGVSTGLPKLDEIISGIQRQTFYLIAGGTGSGKTTLCLYSYVYQPLKKYLGTDDFRVIYYSLEMTGEMILAKLLSMYIYDTFKIQMSYSDILSRKEILNDEYYEYIKKSKEWLEQVKKHLIIYDKTLTTKTLYNHLKEYANANGRFVENEEGTSKIYIPNIENQLVLVVIDHVFLMTQLAGQNKKDSADEAAKILITFRNKCGYSPVVLQQLNRQGSTMDRRKENMQVPELQDLKGTGDVSEAAEIVIMLFNPAKEKMSSWEKYKINLLQDKFRGVCVTKNRFGELDKVVPCNFFGNVNIFREMPKPEEIDDYGPYLDIDYDPDNQVDKSKKEDKKEQFYLL